MQRSAGGQGGETLSVSYGPSSRDGKRPRNSTQTPFKIRAPAQHPGHPFCNSVKSQLFLRITFAARREYPTPSPLPSTRCYYYYRMGERGRREFTLPRTHLWVLHSPSLSFPLSEVVTTLKIISDLEWQFAVLTASLPLLLVYVVGYELIFTSISRKPPSLMNLRQGTLISLDQIIVRLASRQPTSRN